jgi:asparagine N-glycosylation enzyme membrane subunit Stt3
MLFILAAILFVAWLLGMVGAYTIGAFIHVLLVIAVVLFLVGLLSGQRTIV